MGVAEPEWLVWLKAVAAAVAILTPIAIYPIARLINRVRTNDLAHLDMKIDAHHATMTAKNDANHNATTQLLAALQSEFKDITTRLDRHLEWHLGKPSDRKS